jgi:membrane protease YdiL (CAAX protease family)
MRAAAEPAERHRAMEWTAVAAGLALLAGRAYAPLGAPVLAVIYLALVSLAVAPSPFGGTARIHPLAVVGLGLAAVWTARTVAGPAVPVAGVSTAAVALNTLAAVGEEAFFRRFMYDRLVRSGPFVAVAVCSLAFAAVHVPAYGWTAFPVDLGAGLLLGWQRWASGTWLAPAVTHMFANIPVMFR